MTDLAKLELDLINAIGAADSEAWLLCMEKAIARQPYSADFALYLLKQLRVPAERIVQVCQHAQRRPGD